jgi:hypothetical protein
MNTRIFAGNWGQACDSAILLDLSGFSVSNIQDAASNCFSEPNDVFVPGLIVVASAWGGLVVLLDCASAEPIIPSRVAAKGWPKKS